jgi:hypothetical protein
MVLTVSATYCTATSKKGPQTESGSPITTSTEIDAEAVLMESLVYADEDKQLGDGAVEIGSNEEYHD